MMFFQDFINILFFNKTKTGIIHKEKSVKITDMSKKNIFKT